MAMTRYEVSVVMGKPCVTMICDMKRYLYTGCSGILLSVCSWSLYIWESAHLHKVYTDIQLMYNSCTSNNKRMMTYNVQSRTKLSKSRKVVLWVPYKWPYNFQTWEAVKEAKMVKTFLLHRSPQICFKLSHGTKEMLTWDKVNTSASSEKGQSKEIS